MSERLRRLAEFDAQHGVDPGVQITNVSIPFWQTVNIILKFFAAFVVASFIVGAILGAAFLVFTILIQ